MTEAKAGGEPSMEEILASIRQIINQNDKPADGAAEPDTGAAAATSPVAAAPVDMAPITTPDASAVDDAPEDDDVLELTEILAAPASEPAPALEMVDIPEPVFTPAPAVAPQPVAAPAPAAPAPVATPVFEPAAPVGADLISNTSAAAAQAALTSLATTLQQEKNEHSLPVGNGMRTLESMAVEALKPLLKEWLDANLPTIVERIVQQEVEKLTKRLGA